MQIYDKIYLENFETARKQEEESAREAAMREQQAAYGTMQQGGPPGLQSAGWGADPVANGWQGECPLKLSFPSLNLPIVCNRSGLLPEARGNRPQARDVAEYPDSVDSFNTVICERPVTGCVSGLPAVSPMAKQLGGMLIDCCSCRRLGRGSRGL